MNKLDKAIKRIGKKLVRCEWQCDGIENKPKEGKMPRCLILERKGRKRGGIIIIGENPGRAGGKENSELKDNVLHGNNADYGKYLDYWEENKGEKEEKGKEDKGYYGKLREFAERLAFKGPILWTDIVKCQKDTGKKKKSELPAQTIRNCVNEYLLEEVEKAPENWPIIACGKVAFNTVSYLFLDRLIIGIPHVTGSYGYFSKLSSCPEKMREIKKLLTESKGKWYKDACWFNVTV